MLDKLLASSASVQPLALAVRGEHLARTGEERDAKKAFAAAVRLAPNEARVRWLQAQSMAILKEPQLSVKSWGLVLKSGKYDVAAHRGLALTGCTFWPDRRREQQQALEHAQLAHALSGETDWSCRIALALATAVAGDSLSAASLAESAAEHAVAENKLKCLEFAAQLKDGNIPTWQF